MIKDALKAVKTALSDVEGLRYTAEDWGQLDYFTTSPSVSFPCALVDVEAVDYSSSGRGVQTGAARLTVRIADNRIFNGSFRAPQHGDDFEMLDLLQRIYKALQGVSSETFTPLNRTKQVRARRDDSIREFQMYFEFGFTDYDAARQASTRPTPPNIRPARKGTRPRE